MDNVPSYISLYESGELQERIAELEQMLQPCHLCPRRCLVERKDSKVGVCQALSELVVSSAFPHFGEEPPLVGFHGSGTIFLSHCNLRCVFCQNYEISHLGEGGQVSTEQLAAMMIQLQQFGCHNINFVTPTHYTPQIIAALPKAIELGLEIPLVYNCGGYESVETLRLLEGIIDIYMPDFKYSDAAAARRYSNAPDYFEIAKAAVAEMHRQVGVLQLNEQGIAVRGLLIRHLVMPNQVVGSKEILQFIAQQLSPDSYVNIMDQYRPCYKAVHFPEINRRITQKEYDEVIRWALDAGLHRGFYY